MSYSTEQQSEIRKFLKSGSYDANHVLWPGGFIERHKFGNRVLREALLSEVKNRSQGKASISTVPVTNLQAFTRNKVEPMVEGLFPESEQEPILDVLSKSLIFLTPDNIEKIILETAWLHTAWSLANLYLVSIGAEPVGSDEHSGVNIVGLSEETTCFVSLEYFNCNEKFADYVIHEAAHIFHNCKRETVGLPELRRREWLLDIEFTQRETFAYSCEVFSRLCEIGKTSQERRPLLEEYKKCSMLTDERVDQQKHFEALEMAVSSKTTQAGWMKILKVCAPIKRKPKLKVG